MRSHWGRSRTPGQSTTSRAPRLQRSTSIWIELTKRGEHMSATASSTVDRRRERRGSAACRCPRHLRNHGRPRACDDVPLAVPTRAARAARLPHRRRCLRRLDARAARAARTRLHRRNGRAPRRGGLYAIREAAVVLPRRLHGRRHVLPGGGRDRRSQVPGLLPRGPAVPLRHGRRRPREGRA